jgi:hypothetical protein
MPERWQDELKKLRREEMPDGVRERAEAGPRRELPKDGRQRLLAGVVAFAVFIAAGAFAWRAFDGATTTGTEPTPSPKVAPIDLKLDSNGGRPKATLSSADVSQDGSLEGYRWCGSDDQCVSANPDYATYPPVTSYLPVTSSVPIESTGDGQLTRLVIRTTKGDFSSPNTIADTDGTGAVAPGEPGRYLIWISATWGNRGSATYYFGIEVVPPADEIPDVLHMTCTPDHATIDSTVVRPRADGFHVVVEASDDVVGVEVVNDPEEASDLYGVGGGLQDDGEHVFPIEPGAWHIGCYAAHGVVEPGPTAASFSLVDVDGVYTPVALECREPTTRRFPVTGTPASGVDGRYEPTALTVDETVAAVPGILGSDVVREAGYSDGPGFKSGPLYTVLRDGRALARLHIPVEVDTTWSVSVDACAGSGIGPDAQSGEGEPTPDTAGVRCSPTSTEVLTPVAVAQADGLHLDVEYGDGVGYVVAVSGLERDRVFSEPVDAGAGTASLVIPVRPGPNPVTIVCRERPADQDEDVSSDPDAGRLYLQDPSGYFVTYAPSCDSSEEVALVPPTLFRLPAGESFIRVNLAGVLDDDVVERAGYLEGRGDEGPWRIVRNGEVVAQVEYPSLEGITCRSAGITGRR